MTWDNSVDPKIYTISNDGEIINEIPTPTTYGWGLDFDGENFWHVTWNPYYIYKLDPF